jgi:hypothetical protein
MELELRCVVAEVAAVRAEPDDDAEQVTQALAGEPVRVEERRGGWARVRTVYDYPGWVRAEAIEGGEPVEVARAYLGAPYLWGGLTERGIDCSGLVHMAYRRSGRIVPRDADQQEAAGREVAEPRRGDLVTYGSAEGADHVAFWLGGERILHATDREGVQRVVEEDEPASYTPRRRRFIRL